MKDVPVAPRQPPHDGPYVRRVTSREARLWTGRRPRLLAFDVELTERCNNDCIHCYINCSASDDAARRREMGTAEVEDVLRQAASLGAMSVRFTGGEPLLRDDFATLYLAARSLGLSVAITTNATLITPELAALFARIPPRTPIQVSVYGMCRESCQAVTRAKHSFEAAQRGMELLRHYGVPFVTRTTVLPQNRGELDAFEGWSRTVSASEDPPFLSLLLDLRCRRDSEERNRAIARLRWPPRDVVGLLNRRGEAYRRETRQFCVRFLRVPGNRLFGCGAGSKVCIDAYGQCQMCLMLRHPATVYDLRSGSLADAVKRFFPRVREMSAANPEYLRRCARCFLRYVCEQCPAKSWMEHGTLDTPVEYFCDVAHAQAEDLGLVVPGERGWDMADGQERLKRWEAKP